MGGPGGASPQPASHDSHAFEACGDRGPCNPSITSCSITDSHPSPFPPPHSPVTGQLCNRLTLSSHPNPHPSRKTEVTRCREPCIRVLAPLQGLKVPSLPQEVPQRRVFPHAVTPTRGGATSVTQPCPCPSGTAKGHFHTRLHSEGGKRRWERGAHGQVGWPHLGEGERSVLDEVGDQQSWFSLGPEVSWTRDLLC